MKRILSNTTFLLILLTNISVIRAQEAIVTAGSDIQNMDGSISFTIGQIVYHTIENSTFNIAEGIQQPYEITDVSGIENAENIKLSISTYPNPTSDILILSIPEFQNENLYFEIIDLNGKLLSKTQIINSETSISLSTFAKTTYLLIVSDGATAIKTFRIIKN